MGLWDFNLSRTESLSLLGNGEFGRSNCYSHFNHNPKKTKSSDGEKLIIKLSFIGNDEMVLRYFGSAAGIVYPMNLTGT